jgi:hypothetical protein
MYTHVYTFILYISAYICIIYVNIYVHIRSTVEWISDVEAVFQGFDTLKSGYITTEDFSLALDLLNAPVRVYLCIYMYLCKSVYTSIIFRMHIITCTYQYKRT